MSKRILALFAMLTVITMLVVATPFAPAAKSVQSLTMFKASKFNAHYVAPRDEAVAQLLEEKGILLPGADTARRMTAVEAFKTEWFARNPTTPNPLKLKALLDKEAGAASMLRSFQAEEAEEPQIMSLVVPVEFPNEDTFDWCGGTVTTVGPLHNQIPPPGPRDNNTLWYEDASAELYDELYFGVGPMAGVIVHHPNLGEVDLRGNTMANYYLEQSEGAFVPKGMIYPKWLQAAHSEGWYGQDSCSGGNHNVYADQLVFEVVDQVKADNPDLAWQDFDGNADGIVDNFTVIHAGMGQEAGGGAQADFSIWSHASLINWPTGYLACTAGSVGCPDRDIYVREYSMDPENIDVGVIAEEFGHAAFGLPDLYTTDYDNSIADWAIMSAGSWNGILGGAQPAPFPLWFRYLIGWATPVEFDYFTEARQVKVGQLSLRPKGTEQGLKINLPDQEITVPNPLNTGQAWWSDIGDLIENTIAHEFDLTGTSAPVLSFPSYWSMEVDYDGGFVEVSTDGGATWTSLPDLDGYMTQNPLSGNNSDLNWVLTDQGSGVLRFDLSAYAGQVILFRLRYLTDIGVQWDGWWADDFSLDDGGANLFFDDVESGPGSWMTTSWLTVPLTNIYPRYYMAEWRNMSGFDRGLIYPYQTVYSDEDEWEVDRAAYTVPGMLLYYRDAAYRFDYTLGDSWYNPPSYGPKHGLIVIDSHSFPYMWDNYSYGSGQNVRLSRRVQAADATFTLKETTPFTLRLGYDPVTGEYLDTILETKTFEPRPAVSQFHDSLGYYPGLWYQPLNDGLYFWDVAASAVVPAMGNYSTRITWPDDSPLVDLYGYDLGDTILGSGNPGDDLVQFGLHLAVINQAKDGRWGTIKVWNSMSLVEVTKLANTQKVRPGKQVKFLIEVRNTSPVSQAFVLDDPIPAGLTFVKGLKYDPETNSIHWADTLAPGGRKMIYYWAKVNPDTAPGTLIENVATVSDSALGDTASVTIEIIP